MKPVNYQEAEIGEDLFSHRLLEAVKAVLADFVCAFLKPNQFPPEYTQRWELWSFD